MKKHFSKLTLAIILALVMGLSFAGIAFAENGPVTPLEDPTVDITKELVMDPGTAVPDSTFTFTFSQVVAVPDSDPWTFIPRPANSTTDAVTIPNQIIDFLPNGANPGVITLDLGAINWPHAGQFFFVVQETPNTNPDIATDPNQSMIYDDTAWLLMVSVGNFYDANDAPIVRITTIQIAGLTPGTEPGEWYMEDKDEEDELLFRNQYVYNRPPENDTNQENARLAITKEVVGLTRVHADLTTPFTFDATLTIGATAVAAHFATGNTFTLPASITAYVQNYVPGASGAPSTWVNVAPPVPVTFTGNFTAPVGATPGSITFTSPSPDGFQLTDGQRLRFPDNVPAGTTVSVTERALPNWAVQSARFDGAGTWGFATGGYNTAVTADSATLTPPGVVTTAGNNSMDFANRFYHSEIMGLVIGSMPFMVALLGATVLLAMMVASRSRQRIEQLPIAY